jgi:hypothetical protein
MTCCPFLMTGVSASSSRTGHERIADPFACGGYRGIGRVRPLPPPPFFRCGNVLRVINQNARRWVDKVGSGRADFAKATSPEDSPLRPERRSELDCNDATEIARRSRHDALTLPIVRRSEQIPKLSDRWKTIRW